MSLISLLVVLVICGVIVWFVQTYIPLAPPFKAAISIVVAIGLLLYLLEAFGVWHSGLRLR